MVIDKDGGATGRSSDGLIDYLTSEIESEEALLSLANNPPRLEIIPMSSDLVGNNMDEPDFCVCRRCRAISNISHRSGFTPPAAQRSTFGNRRPQQGSISNNTEANHTYLSSEHPGVNTADDDVPLLIDDSYQSEATDHCHFSRNAGSKHGVKKARRQLSISSILCVAFMLAEFIGGYFSGSLAIMTDAAHLLSDLASFLISLFAIWVGQKKPTKEMSFGYYRAEILGAVASVLIIWVLTGILIYMAIERIITKEFDIDADAMIIVSGVGVAINIFMGIVLHGGCLCDFGMPHSHGIGSSHTHNHSHESSNQNINVRAAFIHVIGDLIQSVGVLIAAYIIKYFPQYKIADPICTFLFSALVLFTTITIMRDAIWVLMEGVPRNLSYPDILSMLKNIEGVKTAHSLHIWSLTTDKNALSVHLAIDNGFDPHQVLREAQTLIRKEFGIYQATIQVEKFQTEMTACTDCQGPQC